MRTFLAQGKNNVPVPGVAAGTVAIYDSGPDGTDHLPAIYPKSYLGRVAFHTDFDYLGVVEERTTAVSLPAASAGTGRQSGVVSLFAHGQAGKPLIMAQFSYDNVNWYTINGTTYTSVGFALVGRSLHVQVDAGYVYLLWSVIGNLGALTIYIRVQVLGRTYRANKPNSSEMLYAAPGVLRAKGGLFDTDRGYLQSPAPGQAAKVRHTSGQTIGFFDGDENGEIDIAFANDSSIGSAPVSLFYSSPGPLLPRVQVPLVFEGPSGAGGRLEVSPENGVILANGAGRELLNTGRKMVAITDEVKGSFSFSSHGATAYTVEVPHETIHAAHSITPGASLIFGWLEVTAASPAYIISNRPLDFSGSILLWASGAVFDGAFWARQGVLITPRISGGTLQVVEQWYNHNYAGVADVATPSVSGTYHLFAAALVGGF